MKKNYLRLAAALLCVSMALGACGGAVEPLPSGAAPASPVEQAPADGSAAPEPAAGEEAAAPADQKIIWAIHNEADTLDPGISNNTFASPVLMNAFEGLMTYDQEGNLIPGVASDYTVSDDGLTYTFTLRDGLKWSDGSDLTANDFIYSWTRVITPETAANFYTLISDYILNAIEFFDGTAVIEDVGFKAPDEKTIVLTLKAPAPWFLGVLATYTWSPVKRSAVEANPTGWALDPATYICNGPFKPTAITIGEGYILTKNENYYNAANVKLEEINMRLLPDQATALTAFESGEIDGSYDVPAADIPRLKAESDQFYSIPQFGHTYFIFNTGKAPLDDPRVRKALALAIDRQAIIDNVLQSADTPATGLVPPGYMVDGKDYTEGRPDYGILPNGDVETAKALLAEAGYPDGEGFPALRLSYYTDPNVKLFTEAIHQMWKENLGIEMEITTEEWAVYYDSVQAFDYDVAAMGWGADFLHPTNFLETFKGESINNNTQYNNDAYDELVTTAQSTVDPVAGRDLMLQAEQILVGDDMALLPIFYRSRYTLMSDKVEGWLITALNDTFFKYAVELD